MPRSSRVAPEQETTRQLRRHLAGAVLAALALVASLTYALQSHSSTPVADAQTLLGALTNDDPGTKYLSSFTLQTWTDRIDNKPALVFAGTDSCPYCAVRRWAVVKALSAFGTWSHLKKMVFMSTFDLASSHYHSPYVAFKYTSMEELRLTQREARELLKGNPYGGTLWLLAADRNTANTNLDPALIEKFSFTSVREQLRNGTPSTLTHEINAEANALTAIMCHADGMQPQSACERPVIKHAAARLS